MKNRFMIQAVACMTLGLGVVQAGAEDLGTVTVTAERHEVPANLSSFTVTVIDRNQIEHSHAANLATLLREQPGIVVRDTSGVGAKSQVDLGGFGESAPANSIVLIDGRPVNNPDLSGVDWTQIPLDMIERIEIVHGGGAVLYGAGAVGGVINIITRVPESGGRVSVHGGSFGTSGGHVRMGSDAGSVRTELRVSGSHSNGYRDNGFADFFDAGARAELDVSDTLQLYLRGNQHHDRTGLPGPLSASEIAVNRRQSTSPADFAKTDDGFVEGGLMLTLFTNASLDVPVSYRKRRSESVFSGFPVNSTLRTLTFRPKAEIRYEGSLKGAITFGADVGRGRGALSSVFYRRIQDGYYAHASVSANNGLWRLSGGARHERLEDRFTSGSKLSGLAQNKTNWELGLVVTPVDWAGFYASISTSSRFPLLDERFNFFTSSINTGLLPQTGRHYGIGLRARLADIDFDVSFRRADLSNEIFYNPLTFANENYTDKTRHDVLLVQAGWDATEWLHLRGGYTYTRATFRGGAFDGNFIPAVPKQQFSMAADADWGNGFGATMDLKYLGSSYLISDQANARPQLPSYLVANATVRYRWKDAEAFIRVDNLTNRKYSSYGVHSSFSGDRFYPAPEISVRGGVSYSF